MALAFTGSVQVGSQPTGIAVSPDGLIGYVPNASSGTISVVDLPRLAVVGTIEVPNGEPSVIDNAIPFCVAFAPDGRRAYVVGIIEGGLRVIDVATGTVTEQRLSGPIMAGSPMGVAISPDGRHAYLADPQTPSVQPVELESLVAIFPDLDTDHSGCFDISITRDGNFLYGVTEGCTVVPIDLRTQKAVRPPIVINCDPARACMLPGGSRLLVANHTALLDDHDSSLSLVDLVSNTLIGRETAVGLADGSLVTGVDVSPDGATIYITRWNRETKIGTLSSLSTPF